jgi:DNA repair protein RecO (recombination protein O)
VIKQSTLAIVLRKVNYAGNSGIVTAYTEAFGIVPFLLRGLGRKGSKSATALPLSIVEIVTPYNPSKNVQLVSEINLVENNLALSNHPYKTTVALFLAEVLSKTLREEAAEPDLFHFLKESIQYFIEDDFSADFHLVFLSKLCRFFGFSTSGHPSPETPYFDLTDGVYTSSKNHSVHTLSAADSALLGQLFEMGFEKSNVKWTNIERRNLLNLLMQYYSLHMEGMGKIKSLDVLEAVFS